MVKQSFFLFLLVFLIACGSKDKEIKIPETIIQPDQMVLVLVDFHLAEAAIIDVQSKKENVDQYTNYFYNSILQKHNISRKKFSESISFYNKNLKEFQKIYKDVVVELSKTQSRIISKKLK